MAYFIGLDVSQRKTAVCIIDGTGTVIAEGNCDSRAQTISEWVEIRVGIGEVSKVGLEAGNLSSWLCTGLLKTGLPAICLETFQAHRFLATQRNKTDKNDARGIAQLVRMGENFLKTVTVRSQGSQETRALLGVRQHLVRQKVALENNISGILKPFGLIVRRSGRSPEIFVSRVIETIAAAKTQEVDLEDTIMPTVRVYQAACEQLAVLTKQVVKIANADPVCKRLMTAPGVGPVTSLSFATAVDYPERFKSSSDVGAYFGLTPRQVQSGESDHVAGISRRGDAMVRRHLVSAATVVLTSRKKWCPLKAWGVKLAKRQGMAKARIAVARKLAVTMHKMWINGENFRWQSVPEKELAGLQTA